MRQSRELEPFLGCKSMSLKWMAPTVMGQIWLKDRGVLLHGHSDCETVLERDQGHGSDVEPVVKHASPAYMQSPSLAPLWRTFCAAHIRLDRVTSATSRELNSVQSVTVAFRRFVTNRDLGDLMPWAQWHQYGFCLHQPQLWHVALRGINSLHSPPCDQ